MKQEIDLAVFDMAGTTVNESNVVYKTVQKEINRQGYNVSLEEVLQYGAGKDKHQAIIDVLKNVTTEPSNDYIADLIFENFKKALQKAYETLEVTAFEGVYSLLLYLRTNNIKVVLNTGYDKKTATLLLDKLGWTIGTDIDALITMDDVSQGRPHPDMIYKAMELYNITDTSRVLKAGDSAIDIEEGINANCGITVGVLTGAQSKEQLQKAKPTYILEELSALKDFI